MGIFERSLVFQYNERYLLILESTFMIYNSTYRFPAMLTSKWATESLYDVLMVFLRECLELLSVT